MSQGGAGLGRSTAVMAAGTATSRVLGLVRGAVLAAAIGLNIGAANAFAVANWLPNMIYMLLAGGVLNAVLVPQVVKAYKSDQGQEFVDRLLTLAAVILLGVAVTVTLAAPLVIQVATSSSDPEFVSLATTFAVWCLPQIFFYGLYTLLGQVLNARGSFGPYMWAPVANNVVAIAGLAVFIAMFGSYDPDAPANLEVWGVPRVALLAGTATLGVVVQAAVLVVPLWRSGFRYRPRFGWRGTGLSSAGRVAGWTFAALAVGQLGILTVTRITSSASAAGGYGLEIAGNNAYNYAFLVFMLPHSLVTVSLLTALFTRLSGHAVAQDVEAVRRDTSYGMRTIGVFTIFATAVLAVLALPVARLVAPSVTAAEVSALAPVIVALVAGLVALGIWSLVQRVHYAYEDARSLFWLQLPMSVLVAAGTFAGSLLLAPERWTLAAGASIAASYVLGAVRGVLAVRRRLGGSGRRVLQLHVRAGLAALVSAAVGWPVSLLFGDLSRVGFGIAAVVCVVVGLVMLGVYLGMLRVLRVREVADLLAPAMARLARSMGRPGPGGDDRRDQGAGQSLRGGDRLDGVVIGHGTLLAGRYRLGQPVPSDLPGVEAWSAQDQILDRPVRAMVLREGRIVEAQDAARRAALVTDPRLLRVLDVGDHEGVPYTVTERVEGRDLGELTQHGPIPADQARAIIGEAAVALEVARRRGVHHLALRPSSVRVTEDGRVVVTGLGIDGEVMDRGIGDARSTTRADTVGLVALLYLTLTGRWPAPHGSGAGPGQVTAAPVVGGSPVAPAELSPGVPNDLDTLCSVTLGPHDDGPHSPGELVRELEPWDQVAAAELLRRLDAAGPPTSVMPAVAPLAVLRPTPATPPEAPAEVRAEPDAVVPPAGPDDQDGEAAPDAGKPTTGAAASEPPLDDTTPPAGVQVVSASTASVVARQSVRSAVVGQAPPAPPGTPPPAVPPVGPPRAPRPSTQPTPRPPSSGATASSSSAPSPAPDRQDFDSLIGRSPAVLTRRRFDPTPFVLVLIGLAVVVGVVMAYNRLTAPLPPIGGSDGFGDVQAEETEEGEAPTEEEGDEGEGEAPAEEEETPEEAAAPVIASAQQIDPPPDGDNNEHPEAVDRAIDGDPTTFWFTRTYVSPTYGLKDGVGFAVTLEEPAVVSAVNLAFNGAGGRVQVRATDPSTPTEGAVLVESPLGPDMVLELPEPTQAEHIVLWFPELPQTPDGLNRVELYEISLS